VISRKKFMKTTAKFIVLILHVLLGTSVFGYSPYQFASGQKIRVINAVSVRNAAGGATVLGTQSAGATGVIITGPIRAQHPTNGKTYDWYQVNYDNSTLDGWSAALEIPFDDSASREKYLGLHRAEVASVAHQAGFHGFGLVAAIAIAEAESIGMNPSAVGDFNYCGVTGPASFGLWQINTASCANPSWVPQSLLSSPFYCAQAAWSISGSQTNFHPWSTWFQVSGVSVGDGNGVYKNYVSFARGVITTAIDPTVITGINIGIRASDNAFVRNTPGGSLASGQNPRNIGDTGTIIDGATDTTYLVQVGGSGRYYFWWKIRWSDGQEGWSAEDFLERTGASPQTGSLQVTINPAGAVNAGGQWQVDGGSFQNSGAIVSNLSTGTHTVAFKPISGWTTPSNQSVTINANQTTQTSGTYVANPQTGSLQVTINPAGAVNAGGQWQVDGGSFQNSGAIVSNLSTGTHTVAFKPISGWTTPSNQSVTINANQTTQTSGTYAVSPTPTPNPSCPPTITQSSTQSITAHDSVSCNDGVGHTDNSYWRAFNMTSVVGSNPYHVTSVSFGVEQAIGASGTQSVTARLYTTSNFPSGFPESLSQIATSTVNVPNSASGTIFNVALTATVPVGTPQLVMELFTPDGQAAGNLLYVGANADPETGPSYLSAATCGFTTPTTTAVVGFPNMHIIFNVNGNCSTGNPNPIDDPTFFVTQHYSDFLNRNPDQSGLSFWINQITSCNGDPQCIDIRRQNVSAAFFLSIEFQETGFYVITLQRGAFGKISNDSTRRITFQQFLNDAQQVSAGVVQGQPGWDIILDQNKTAYAQNVVESAAFINRYPTTLPASAYVDALFASAGVTPTSLEWQAAITAFGGGGTTGRTAALRKVAETSTVKNAEFNSAFVLMQYFGYMRRNPTDPPDFNDSGYQFWLSKLNQFNGNFVDSEMVKAFIVAGEYRDRFN
jgi:hypothetical protein